MRRTRTHLFFWQGLFSNWARTPFAGWDAFPELEARLTAAGIAFPGRDLVITKRLMGFRYRCVEQWMAACSAWFFGDQETLDAVRRADEPADQKKLGDQVRGFDPRTWNVVSEHVGVSGCIAKFGSDERLTRELLDTGDLVLVAAGRYDRTWGIGIDWRNDDVLDQTRWRGDNRHGRCLMTARSVLALKAAQA